MYCDIKLSTPNNIIVIIIKIFILTTPSVTKICGMVSFTLALDLFIYRLGPTITYKLQYII